MPRPLRKFFRHGFLPQLMAFEACIRLGSVTRAAEELSLAQPTVSCMLRKLSETVGGPVTVLRDRRVEPTELGQELLVLAHDVVHALARYEARNGATPLYDPVPSLPAASPSPWPSSSLPRNRSRWKQRVSPCPLARLGPATEAGAS